VRVDGGGYGGLWHKGTAGLGLENNGELTGVKNTERESWEGWPPARHLAVTCGLVLALLSKRERNTV
jgi:hypothetical protein